MRTQIVYDTNSALPEAQSNMMCYIIKIYLVITISFLKMKQIKIISNRYQNDETSIS